jgi:hypothetical protein
VEKKDQPISVRIPIEIYEWIREAAAANDRSINGQIVHLLRQARINAAESGEDPL